MPEDTPTTDERPPADVVSAMVDETMALAQTWPAWDGVPRQVADRVYTPHKAIRRVTDHLIDHLAEVESRVAGAAPLPDHWHGSAMTSMADCAVFTAEDLDEAYSRLSRLRQLWQLRLETLTDQELDEGVGGAWTLRQVAFHVAESSYYAEVVGDLSRQ